MITNAITPPSLSNLHSGLLGNMLGDQEKTLINKSNYSSDKRFDEILKELKAKKCID